MNQETWTTRDLMDSATNYAMKSDILRLEILYKYGGIYVDIDSTALRSFGKERFGSERNKKPSSLLDLSNPLRPPLKTLQTLSTLTNHYLKQFICSKGQCSIMPSSHTAPSTG